MKTTGKQYKKEYDELIRKSTALSNRVTERLIQLATLHPNAVVAKWKNTEIKASPALLYRPYVERMTLEERIEYIRIIEKWLEDQNPVKQGVIPFPE